MKFFIYSRKSVYTGKGESVENQAEMSRQYIFSKFGNEEECNIVVYEDEGFSAKNTKRPAFQKMIRDMKEDKPDYVVCYRLDRISRSVSDFSALIEELNDMGISFLCIKEEFDTSKPMGKAMMYIASVFAQLERETIAERVRDNMLMLARTGRWLGGNTPTGFTSEKVRDVIIDGKEKTSCRLKFDNEEIEKVKIIFDKMLELHSIAGVSKYLIKENIKSRNGKFFSPVSIREILSNPVYCIADKEARDYFAAQNSDLCFEESECSQKYGLISYNKRDYRKTKAPRKSKDQWIIAIGRHRGIVSGKKWAEVQYLMDTNGFSRSEMKLHNDYSLLSGLIFCKNCGGRMYAKAHSKMKENGIFYYICQNKMRGGVSFCGSGNLNGRQTDDIVCGHIAQYMQGDSDICKILEKLKRDIRNESGKDALDILDAKIKKCKDETENYMETLSTGGLGEVFIQKVNKKITLLDKEIERLEVERKNVMSAKNRLGGNSIELAEAADALSDLKGNFDKFDVHEKRVLIRMIVQKIEWDGKDLNIFVYGN